MWAVVPRGLLGLLLLTATAEVVAADSVPHLVGKESNVTFTDMSPMFAYSPSASGPIDSAWNQTWTNASWAQYTPLWPVDRLDDGSSPVSAHTTQHAGASVTVNFLGTAIYFYGTAKGSFSVDVGGKKSDVDLDTSEIGLIASVTGLDNVAQQATITLKSGELSINSAIVTLQVGGQGATIVNSTYTSYYETTTYYMPSSNITWSQETANEWYMNSSMCGEYKTETTDGSSCWRAPRVQTVTPKASFILRPPANSSFISLYTTTGSSEGPYTVTIDPPLFDGPATTSYTQGNPWLAIPDVVMFFTPLDFRKQYTIIVQFTGDAGQYLNFRYGRILTTSGGDMTQPGATPGSGTTSSNGNGPSSNANVTNSRGSSSSGSSSSNKAPIGAIVGGVVGGVVALIALALILFFCCRRRKNHPSDDAMPLGQPKRHNAKRGFLRRPPSGLSDFEVDVSDKPVYDVDGNQSHPSLHPATDAELNVTPLMISGPVGMRVADQKALEAARESAAAASPMSSPQHAYPPSPAGYATPIGGSQAPTSPTASGSEPATLHGGFRPYTSPTAANQLVVSNPSAPGSDYAYSQGLSSPLSPQSSSPVSPFGEKSPWAAPLAPLAAHEAVAEEVDAGRIVQPKESVPPRYNPAWVDENDPHRRM